MSHCASRRLGSRNEDTPPAARRAAGRLVWAILRSLFGVSRRSVAQQKIRQPLQGATHVEQAGVGVDVHGEVEGGMAPFGKLRAVGQPNGMAASVVRGDEFPMGRT